MRLYRRKWKDGGGKARKARFWTVDYRDHKGKRKRKTLKTTSEQAAKLMVADLIRTVELRRAGVEKCDGDRVPIAKHVTDYVADLRRLERDEKHVTTQERRLAVLTKGVKTIDELTPDAIGQKLAALSVEKAWSARTQNFYRSTLASFFLWLVRQGRWHTNPVKAVEAARVVGNLKERVALTVGQLTALVDTAPIHRGVVYLFAALTGLRRKELADQLETDLELANAGVKIRARTAKDRTADYLPLAPWVVDLLRRYLAEVTPTTVVTNTNGALMKPRGPWLFVGIPGVDTLRADLKRAGVRLALAEHEVFDFHSLRTTFGTLLALAGAAPRVAQELMRHSDGKLTETVYQRVVSLDKRAAVDRIRPEQTVPGTVPHAPLGRRIAIG